MTLRNLCKAALAILSGQGRLVRSRRDIEWRSSEYAGKAGRAVLSTPPAHPYHSQCGQDRFLAEQVFQHRRNGAFVDIGAFDGVEFSNTCYFEKELGWTGLCVEPNPAVFARLIKNRNCQCANVCVSDHNGTATFIQFPQAEMFSGLAQSVSRLNGNSGAAHNELAVSCLEANRLLAEKGLSRIDYLSIDTEGMDFAILKSLDLSRFDIEVISIENNAFAFGYDIMAWLDARGYDLIAILGDEIYRKR